MATDVSVTCLLLLSSFVRGLMEKVKDKGKVNMEEGVEENILQFR